MDEFLKRLIDDYYCREEDEKRRGWQRCKREVVIIQDNARLPPIVQSELPPTCTTTERSYCSSTVSTISTEDEDDDCSMVGLLPSRHTRLRNSKKNRNRKVPTILERTHITTTKVKYSRWRTNADCRNDDDKERSRRMNRSIPKPPQRTNSINNLDCNYGDSDCRPTQSRVISGCGTNNVCTSTVSWKVPCSMDASTPVRRNSSSKPHKTPKIPKRQESMDDNKSASSQQHRIIEQEMNKKQ